MLKAALEYAGRGWHVFPAFEVLNGGCACGNPDCKSPGKHPKLRNGLTGASATPGVLESWWSEVYGPGSNVGVRTGRESGIVVIDLDLHKPGAEQAIAAWLADRGGDWGSPRLAETGSGGVHLYYRYPVIGDSEKVATRKAIDGVQGLDVRGDGGLVIAPPSRNLVGPYVWASDNEPGELPEALLAALVAERKAPAAPVAQSDWRPAVVLTRAHLETSKHKAAKRILQGQAWAEYGSKHGEMISLCFALCCEFGPVNAFTSDVAALLERTCEAARATDPQTKASVQQWQECFAGRWAIAEAEHARKRETLEAAERLATATASIDKVFSEVKQDTAPFTRASLSALVKKAKDPNHAAILKIAHAGGEVPTELEAALESCGRWVAQKTGQAPDKVMPHFAQLACSTPGLAAFRAGLETGHALAHDKEAWRRGLTIGDNEKPLACIKNAIHVLTLHPDMQGVIVYDERAQNFRFQKPAPWPRGDEHFLETSDGTSCAVWLTQVTGLGFTSQMAYDALVGLRRKVLSYDPVSHYLLTRAWDGVARLDTWLRDYAGVADTDYTRAVARCTLLAAVARALKPGCKADTVLVLEGPQGYRKSTLVRELCAVPDWFAEHEGALSGRDKDAVQLIACGPWIVELGELAGLGRAELNTIKQFVTRAVDKFRPPYGRVTESFPRKTVFIATTNDSEYLKDLTGNRRWLPVNVKQCNPDALALVRDQLWAEAVVAVQAGEPWWITDPEVLEDAAEQQKARLETDAWDEELGSWLENNLKPVSVKQLLVAVGVPASNANSAEVRRLRGVLTRAGYLQGEKERRDGIVTRFWRRPGWSAEGGEISAADAAKLIASG